MKVPHVVLALAAIFFLAWIGWLAYLVAISQNVVILSRPQLLVADLWVIGDVAAEPDGRPRSTISIREVVWSAPSAKVDGKQMQVRDLPDLGPENGWNGPGEYILPLSVHKNGKEEYSVTLLPPSPGFFPKERDRKRIYPATLEPRQQLLELKKKWKEQVRQAER
jgi:hypothetical protein